MKDATRTRIIIGIAAVIWFIVALFGGRKGVAQVSLRSFSLAVSIATMIFALYDKYLWRWSIVRRFTKKPLLEGTWRGTLQSDFERPGESTPIDVIPTVIRITQSDSMLLVTQFTNESTSITEQGQLRKEADGRWRLSWLYTNQPRLTIQNRSAAHRGAADLWVSGDSGEELDGGYFSDRKTRGDLHFTEWSKKSFADSASALASSDFKPARPFVKGEHL